MRDLIVIKVGLFLGLCLFIQACIGPALNVYERDISTFTPLSELRLNLPQGETKKVETTYMVAFLAPSYEASMQSAVEAQRDSILQFQRTTEGKVGLELYREMDVAKVDYLDQVKKTLQKDLEHILLSKNIRVLGPFKSHREMTFDEKKRAIYTFTPEISINVVPKFKSLSEQGYTEEGEIIVSGLVTFTLSESMTGEKLWVKRMEADPATKPYKFTAKYKETYHAEQTLGFAGIPLPSSSVDEKDNTDQVLASALSDFYSVLGGKLWKHVDPEEWGKYLDQARGLREQKRF